MVFTVELSKALELNKRTPSCFGESYGSYVLHYFGKPWQKMRVSSYIVALKQDKQKKNLDIQLCVVKLVNISCSDLSWET